MAETTSNGDPRGTSDENGIGSKSEAAPGGTIIGESPGTNASDTPKSPAPRRTPAKCQACTSCRQKKIKCNGVKPICAACVRSGADCLYVPSRRRGRPARAHREYERPYMNPLPILPRQPTALAPATHSSDQAKYQPPQQQQNKQQQQPNTVLPTLPHLQPAQAGQGTLPPPPPTAPPGSAVLSSPLPPILSSTQSNRHHHHIQQHQQHHGSIHQRLHSHQQQQQQQPQQTLAPIGSILAAALFPGSPHSTSEDDAVQSGHRSSGSESPLPHAVRLPPFLVPGGDRGGHQTMMQTTPLVIPHPSRLLPTHTSSTGGSGTDTNTGVGVGSSSGGGGNGGGSSYMDPNIVEFFHYFNALFPIVHWPSFREAYDDGTVPNYMILAIRALSKRYSKQPSVVLSGQLYAAGQDLAAIATSLAEVATREDPNTYLIQTWIILSMFEFGMGRMKQAADRRELAVRLAYQLDLSNIEVRASQRRARSLIVAENCRRVWWTLFYADRYFSLVSSEPSICPAIHEATYKVGFPRTMREATPPPQPAGSAGDGRPSDIEFPRYNDHDVILWFQSSIPLSLIMGHLSHQCRAAEQLFRNGLAERSTAKLWEDTEWLAALNEFVKSFLVIDAEIVQWRQQLNAASTMSASMGENGSWTPPSPPHGKKAEEEGSSPAPQRDTARNNGGSNNAHSTRDVTLFHRELQYHGIVIIHQCLALYSYEKLRQSLSVLASACTSLLWLESTATQAWKKVVRAADFIRARTNARATELANARASASGTMTNGAAPEPEWELCAPHMPFILYLAAKVHVCQYHWQKIALARTRSQIHRHAQQQEQQEQRHQEQHQVTPSFLQPFSQPPSVAGTPASGQEGWTNGTMSQTCNDDGSAPGKHNVGLESKNNNNSDNSNGLAADSRDTEGTHVMTTSGAAALAAAQAAHAAAAAASAASKTPTPQRSRGGSTTQLSALYADDGDSDSMEMMDVTPPPPPPPGASSLAAAQNQQHQNGGGRSDDYSGLEMNIEDIDYADDDGVAFLVDDDIEDRLARRVESSEERLRLLLRLLGTCQEYWADHDYVQILHDMLQWPDEWTTSMHMLERLLLELRID
ncbi:hypothetical protein H4217_000942 [Coemansia sp. RSA 1939]|nr:hypothetical protein H4217_000942 [Coemansia sp. RSA 1939]KAJ2616312.1 hypothetical protein EV177_001143 [Coemansia sp. RSA 1804]